MTQSHPTEEDAHNTIFRDDSDQRKFLELIGQAEAQEMKEKFDLALNH